MAKNKKEFEEDLLAGGAGLSSDKEKNKSEKKAQTAAKKAEKNAAKIASKKEKLLKEIDSVKSAIDAESDSAKKEKLQAELKVKQAKLASLGSKKAAIQLAKRTQKIVTSVVAVVVVVALLVTYVATGAVRKGFVSYLGIPAQYFTGMTVKDDDNHSIKIKVSTYNYYFATTYNNLQQMQTQYQQYGLDLSQYNMDVDFDQPLSKQTTKNDDDEEVTWAEYLHEQVLDSIKTNYLYYLEAVDANGGEEPEITEEQQSDLDDTVKEYREAAEGYGYTLSGYLVRVMGRGVTEKAFKKEVKIAYIAQNYQSELSEKQAEKEYTDADYKAYQKEHLDDLNSVSVRLFECDNEDDAKSFKKALKSDGSNFADLCSQYASTDFEKKAYKANGFSTMLDVTKSTLINNSFAIATAADHEHAEGEEHSDDEEVSYPGLDWLYSKDRKAGDIKQYSTTVVYVIRPVKLSDVQTVNVRHILIKPETEDESASASSATTEQWNAAKEKAEKILKEFKSGKKTEDSFSELAKKNSADGNASEGGLYENVYPGQMVNSFSAWCFDSSRKSGDVAIVQTEYGYHIIYFVKATGTPAWQYTAQQALASDDSQDATKKLEDSYELKVNWLGSRYFEKDTDIDA